MDVYLVVGTRIVCSVCALARVGKKQMVTYRQRTPKARVYDLFACMFRQNSRRLNTIAFVVSITILDIILIIESCFDSIIAPKQSVFG